jgi:hypothetical protein
MASRVVFALALVTSFVLAGCGGISLGDLDQYVVTWKLAVTNDGTDTAAVTLSIADKVQTQTLHPGAAFYITSFKGGPWHVTIVDATKRTAFLNQRYTDLNNAFLVAMTGGSADPSQLLAAMGAVGKAIDTADQSVVGGGACAGSLPDQSGDTLTIRAAQTNSSAWYCAP